MKYEGRNPLEKLREGEIYFFLRAQDQLAPETVQFYADALFAASRKEPDRRKSNELYKQALECLRVASAMVDWQLDHADFVKLPD